MSRFQTLLGTRLPVLAVAVAVAAAACGPDLGGGPPTRPPIVAGSSDAPREVNLITRDFAFVPDTLDLVPGETILLHVINGGLLTHEAIIGGAGVQGAWEAAEAAVAGAPPGPTPVVSVPPEVAGVRVVVASGERVDVAWTVPVDVVASGGGGGASAGPSWVVGCHIPGHWAKGMQIPVRWVVATPADTRP